MHLRTLIACALVSASAFTMPASAALITWQSPVTVVTSDPTQVLNYNTLAVSAAQIAETVNGVTFPATVELNTINESGGVAGVFGPNLNPYQHLLSAGLYRATGASATTTLGGLTVGKSYIVQIFTPYWDNPYPTRLISGANIVDLGNTGTVPTFVTGTFTADALTQAFDWTASPGSNFGLLDAVQIRVLPEPASAGLLALAAAGLMRRRRV